MDFLGNQMGDGFSWESNGGCKINNMIRLVPAGIESGRGKYGLFRDSLVWRATSEKGFFMPRVRERGCGLQNFSLPIEVINERKPLLPTPTEVSTERKKVVSHLAEVMNLQQY